MKNTTFRDIERISAHLDGQLSRAEATRLEAELNASPELRAIDEQMRQARLALRSLPKRRAPRNFTLTPKMAGVRPPVPRLVPLLRLAAVAAMVLLAFSFAGKIALPLGASAPMAAYGMGGGGGAEGPLEERAQSSDNAETEPKLPEDTPAPEAADAEVAMPTTTPEVVMALPPDVQPTPEPSMMLSAPAPEVEPTAEEAQPAAESLFSLWQFGLAGAVVMFGLAAAAAGWMSRLRFQKRNAKK